MPLDVLEAQLESFFRHAVRRAGGYTFKLAPTEAGVPDRLVLLRGQLYLVELKRLSGRLSPIQRVWHDRINRLGGGVVTLYGVEHAALWILDPDNNATSQRRSG